jgi:hypothetical protein
MSMRESEQYRSERFCCTLPKWSLVWVWFA